MKRFLALMIMILIIAQISAFDSSALEYEFDYDENNINKELNNLFDRLPKEIKDKLTPVSEAEANRISSKYNFNYFLDAIKQEVLKLFPDTLNLLSKIIAIVVLIAIFNNFQKTINCSSLAPSIDMCFSFVSVLSIGTVHKDIFAVVEKFLSILSDTMLLIVPVMEAVYISLGNYTQAAISVTGITLMISFTENVFANAIYPSIIISFLMTTLSCLTKNKAITYISKCLKSLITSSIVTIMTLMTFALTLQLSAASATDNFTNRTVRFALGSYIPIVGGAVSETYSLVQGSISLIKSLSGTTAIAIIILLSIGPLISLVLSKIAISISASLAGALNCDNEEALLSEINSNYILLISVVLSCSLMYIIALAQFCKAATMVN